MSCIRVYHENFARILRLKSYIHNNLQTKVTVFTFFCQTTFWAAVSANSGEHYDEYEAAEWPLLWNDAQLQQAETSVLCFAELTIHSDH